MNLYSSINYNVNAKATDIINYFEIKKYMKTVLVDGEKKRLKGYELISSYEKQLRDNNKQY